MVRESLGFVELEWTCPKCGNRNPGPQKTCTSCGAPQPDDVQFEQIQGKELVKDEALQRQVESGADIHCAFCGARNPSGAATCSQCGADLREGKRREKGRVIGAYKATPVRQITCPSCGAQNPETALKCSGCGAALIRPTPPQQVEKPLHPANAKPTSLRSKPNCLFIGLGFVLIFLCITSLIALFSLSSSQESQEAIVQGVSWETSIEIESLQPVTLQTWRSEVPVQAQLGICRDKVHHIEENEPIGQKYNKICGTPFIIDAGTGQGQVVQDCEFEVLLPYCEYMVDEWQVMDVVSQSGTGFSVAFPDPYISAKQRLGQQSEEYVVVFESPEGRYSYSVSNFDDFQRFQIGTQWILNLNAFDRVISVEPAQ